MYSALANGGEHAGIRLLTAEGVDRARQGQGATVDVVLGIGNGGQPSEWALGYILSGEQGLLGPNPNTFGHGGYGGSFGLADPDAHVAVGYVMNHMGNNLVGDPRQVAIFTALYECL
jgi:CubicO group peptidase (beta-lactamase class C family)